MLGKLKKRKRTRRGVKKRLPNGDSSERGSPHSVKMGRETNIIHSCRIIVGTK